ncbi:MAG: elongation factor Ts [Fusobacteria bacterium]|nr:elongation factor Ts [Fusobacteriota bacterium]
MANITAGMVKELREKTGAGMLECKKALEEAAGDIEKAIEILRKKGIAKAAKKSGRVAAEGIVITKTTDDGKKGIVLEFNTETDFAAKNENVIAVSNKLSDIALEKGISDVEVLKKELIDGKTAEEVVVEIVAKIGENMNVRRVNAFEAKDNSFITVYSHLGGKIGVILELEGKKSEEADEIAKNIAMHIAAMNPKYLTKDEVTTETLEKEKEIERVQLEKEGKPANIIEKILTGKMNKFYEENCLLNQKFVRDDKLTVEKYAGALKIVRFDRYQLGEGIEKETLDFAAEVAAQMSGK